MSTATPHETPADRRHRAIGQAVTKLRTDIARARRDRGHLDDRLVIGVRATDVELLLDGFDQVCRDAAVLLEAQQRHEQTYGRLAATRPAEPLFPDPYVLDDPEPAPPTGRPLTHAKLERLEAHEREHGHPYWHVGPKTAIGAGRCGRCEQEAGQ